MEYCEQHMTTMKDIESIKQTLIRVEKSFEDVETRMVAHINEGEQEGGFRDRVRDLEKETESQASVISALKKAEWKRVITSGVIGGIVARSPEVWNLVLNFLR